MSTSAVAEPEVALEKKEAEDVLPFPIRFAERIGKVIVPKPGQPVEAYDDATTVFYTHPQREDTATDDY